MLRADTSSDGWVSVSYLVDRGHHAYMSFKFANTKPDYAVSVQIAGDSGTTMRPFLGLSLGMAREALISRIGTPSSIEHQADVNADLYVYRDRNYSFEINSKGRIASVQIFGDEGFPKGPPKHVPTLDSLVTSMRRGGSGAAAYLSAELEIYRDKNTITFEHAALTDLSSESSDLAAALFRGPTSLLGILQDSSTRAKADASVRVWEKGGVGWAIKFPVPIPIAALVFKIESGSWRLWEVTYR